MMKNFLVVRMSIRSRSTGREVDLRKSRIALYADVARPIDQPNLQTAVAAPAGSAVFFPRWIRSTPSAAIKQRLPAAMNATV